MDRRTPLARLVVIGWALVALAGCAHNGDGKPAVCDGRHRRPANPYGSVLPTLPGTPDAKRSPSDAKAPPQPGPLSAIDPRSLTPCGTRA